MPQLRLLALLVALVSSLTLVTTDFAEARAGSGSNTGSRGSRTYTAPPATNTAPKAAPVERSMTPRATAPAQGMQSAAQGSRFGGFRGLLMGGLFAVALGSIFGFGALASVLGFILQFALIAGLLYLAYAFFKRRSQPAVAQGPDSFARGSGSARAPLGGFAGQSAAAAATTAYTVSNDDLDEFERLLGRTQTAFSREDMDTLGRITTPEMLSHFSQQLADNMRNGVRNEISGVKLLQGDVSEAWREGGSTYATVAMRYALVDAMIDRSSKRVVQGDLERPTEATEFWTFRKDDRTAGEGWQLSAIQQAA